MLYDKLCYGNQCEIMYKFLLMVVHYTQLNNNEKKNTFKD